MARRGCLPAALVGVVSLAALLVALVAGLNALGCCAIDCEKFPEQCAINERRQQTASLAMLGALVVGAAAFGGAVHLLRRR